MDWIVDTLRRYPEIAIFLTLAIGFFVGSLKLGRFSLGAVTGTLLAGVLIGQLQIEISPNVKSVFFLMFLFAVGYGVGPQFFRGLKGDGLQQVLFALIVCVSVLLSAYLAALIAGYDVGQAAGLLAGAATISAVLGVATDSINQLGLPADQAKRLVDVMPVAYAVTYLYGTAGSAWFLASIGPKLLGVDLAKACREYEEQMGGTTLPAGGIPTYTPVGIRAYRVAEHSPVANWTVGDLETRVAKSFARGFVMRIRHGDRIVDSEPTMVMQPGDVVAVAAPRELLVEHGAELGPEVDDPDLLRFPAEELDVVITNKEVAGLTVAELAQTAGKRGHGVFLRKILRSGEEMPFMPSTRLDRGDVLRIAGSTAEVERAAALLGYADRPTEKTDVVFMGLGIAIGALVGAIAVRVGGVPISLSTSGGALIAGLVCGYLRAVHPTFGRIPPGALWAFNNMGLTIFIAVVGISTGPGFVTGLRQAGLGLFFSGVFVTTLPFVVGIYAGKYLFKMHPGILLGACAGARTTTAALGAIQDEAKSKVPALGYTITYAVGNTLLIIWGVVIVLLMS